MRRAVEEGAQNNHLPLDPMRSLISLDKRVDTPSATIGDIVTYKVTVQNKSDRDLVYDVTNDPSVAFNGVFIQDTFPPAGTLRFIPDSARARLVHGGDVTAKNWEQGAEFDLYFHGIR